MYYKFNRAGVKNEAKHLLQSNSLWFKAFFTILPVLIFNSLSSQIQTTRYIYLMQRYGLKMFLQNIPKTSTLYLTNFLSAISLLSIPFFIAVSGYFLNILRQKNPSFTSLYKETFKNYGKYFTVSLVKAIIISAVSAIFIIPVIISTTIFILQKHNTFLTSYKLSAIILVFIILNFIFITILNIILSQMNYIIHDNPGLTPMQTIKMSVLMTKGYRWQIFELHISFAGWYLLVMLSLGILSIYVYPYFETAKAMYYENLKKLSIQNSVIAADAFVSTTSAEYMGNFQ